MICPPSWGIMLKNDPELGGAVMEIRNIASTDDRSEISAIYENILLFIFIIYFRIPKTQNKNDI